MQIDRIVSNQPKKKVFFCWNVKAHPNFTEYQWTQDNKQNEIVFCPICNQAHKIANRMTD